MVGRTHNNGSTHQRAVAVAVAKVRFDKLGGARIRECSVCICRKWERTVRGAIKLGAFVLYRSGLGWACVVCALGYHVQPRCTSHSTINLIELCRTIRLGHLESNVASSVGWQNGHSTNGAILLHTCIHAWYNSASFAISASLSLLYSCPAFFLLL